MQIQKTDKTQKRKREGSKEKTLINKDIPPMQERLLFLSTTQYTYIELY